MRSAAPILPSDDIGLHVSSAQGSVLGARSGALFMNECSAARNSANGGEFGAPHDVYGARGHVSTFPKCEIRADRMRVRLCRCSAHRKRGRGVPHRVAEIGPFDVALGSA